MYDNEQRQKESRKQKTKKKKEKNTEISWFLQSPMDKVSRGPGDNGTNGQRVISSTQGQSLLKKKGQFELVSEEGPSCIDSLFAIERIKGKCQS